MHKIAKLLVLFLFTIGTALSGYGQASGNRTLTGKVIDDRGMAVPGVTVVIKGTTTGTITDIDGNYSFRF